MNSKIPKRIFQTFETKYFSSEFQNIVDSWKEYNPTYTYTLYDAIEREEFIEQHFDIKVLNAYRRIKPGAFKADLWRYCVLYIYGGVYVDIDTLCFRSIDTFLKEDTEFMTVVDLGESYRLSNGFIASIPKSPILMYSIKYIIHNVETNTIPESRLDFSGPGVLGKSLNIYLNQAETSSFFGKEGQINTIYLLYFEPNTEYIKDKEGNILFQNKNGNPMIQHLYHNEMITAKVLCWVNSPKILD